jgi:putative sterol carrier protein
MTTAAEVIEQMPSAFQPEAAGNLNADVVFELSGDGGGVWTVSIADGNCTVNEGATADPSAKIMMAANDYVKMSQGDLNPVTAFMMGQIKVEGDLNTVMKIQQVFG